jgi:hypothetical protein
VLPDSQAGGAADWECPLAVDGFGGHDERSAIEATMDPFDTGSRNQAAKIPDGLHGCYRTERRSGEGCPLGRYEEE